MSSEPGSDKECNDDVSSRGPSAQTLVLNDLLETGQTLSIAMKRKGAGGSHICSNPPARNEHLAEMAVILAQAGLSLVDVTKH